MGALFRGKRSVDGPPKFPRMSIKPKSPADALGTAAVFAPSPAHVNPGQAGRADPQAPPRPPRLLDAVRQAVRVRHYSIRTESAYADWVRRFIRFYGLRHPREMGPAEVAAFLTHLAVDRTVSPSTQNQARSALVFLYRHVLQAELPWLQEVVAAKVQRRLPVTRSLPPLPSRTRISRCSKPMSFTRRRSASSSRMPVP
ncbi:MAG: phage integrase N-terminal SAM-like domain-containing protein [Betaproteobacteria bacterium]